jgi:hypothetical protein
MIEDLLKQIEFAKSHSTIKNAEGICVYKGKKLLLAGWTRLPLKYHYSSPDSPQHEVLHISAMQDVVIKLGSYRRVSYSDLDIGLEKEPTLSDLALIVEMGFKKLWIMGNPKPFDPIDYFHEKLRGEGIKF